MNTSATPLKNSAKLAAIDPARTHAMQQSQAVLEQMYGYFYYEPMPLDQDQRLAA